MAFVSYAQNFEDVLLWRAFSTIKDGFYIDVGAYDPIIDSVTAAFYQHGWHGVNVEPVEEQFKRLASSRSRDINLSIGLGRRSETATLYVFPSTGLSTMSREFAEQHIAADRPMHKHTIQIRTLAEVCREHAPADIHFLKIDVEGAERDVLAGADFSQHRPKIILVEATRPGSPVPNHQGWEPILLSADYRFVWFDGLNRFYAAAEHYPELAPCFTTPPNIFDKFTVRRWTPTARPVPPAPLIKSGVPASIGSDARVLMTARCRDADPIPKVSMAGKVSVEADGTRVQTMHNGLKVVADGYCGKWMTRLIELCHGHHEPQEERIFHEVMSRLGAGGIMIELGGYWAYYSLWFLQGAPERRAIVVEPDPAHREVGEANARLNGLSPEFLSGFVGEHGPGLFRTESAGVLALPHISVPELIEKRGIHSLDLLHCDTQGTELAVLESCAGLFRQARIRWVFVSTHAWQISRDPLTHQRCLALLRDAGAAIEAEHDVHESFSGDGLIVARFGDAPPGWTPIELSRNRYSQSLFRNPLYDLAERMSAFGPEQAALIVEGVYNALLLRSPNPGGLRAQAEKLMKSGDPGSLISGVLRSAEFINRLPALLGSNGISDRETDLGRYGGAGGPLSCSGLRFRLDRDGPLGRRGDSLLVPYDKTMLPTVFSRASWQTEAIRFMCESMHEQNKYILLDIGANIGLFTRQLLHAKAGIAICLCVEPDPSNFEALKYNLESLDDGRIRLYQHALGTHDGEAVFFRDRENFGNLSVNSDAMRGRPFDTTSVPIKDTAAWMRHNVPGNGPILWKSDTQGHDEVIVAATPWQVWDRVHCAVIELWRIEKPSIGQAALRARIESFPNRTISGIGPVSTDEIMDYLSGRDWAHADLYLSRV
jgi:FkbM family methyltransferase